MEDDAELLATGRNIVTYVCDDCERTWTGPAHEDGEVAVDPDGVARCGTHTHVDCFIRENEKCPVHGQQDD